MIGFLDAMRIPYIFILFYRMLLLIYISCFNRFEFVAIHYHWQKSCKIVFSFSTWIIPCNTSTAHTRFFIRNPDFGQFWVESSSFLAEISSILETLYSLHYLMLLNYFSDQELSSSDIVFTLTSIFGKLAKYSWQIWGQRLRNQVS